MTDPEEHRRYIAVRHEAARLGYRIELEYVPRRTPVHIAVAYPTKADSVPSERKFLCNGSVALDTAEDGLEILRSVREGGRPWPDGT